MKYTMSIKFYKSFKNKQNIEIGPITIFVGPNSAGKSSILKLLGFLHQNYHVLNFNTNPRYSQFGVQSQKYNDFLSFYMN
jgi:AAA15 family ATPase/GTPase